MKRGRSAPAALSERTLIEEVLAPLTGGAEGALGLSDDAAFLATDPDRDLVLTQDTLVEGVHFRSEDAPSAIARKALRVNLSDLAAKGAEPCAYFLSLALPVRVDRKWADDFARGLARDQAEFSLTLQGGDTVRTPGPLVVTVTACGTVPRGTMVRRSGARAGEGVWVSGTIGDGALGLLALAGGTAAVDALSARRRDALAERYLLPSPRLALAPVLRGHASAAMDISDGLAGDLALLARASGVSAEIALGAVPLSAAAGAAIGADAALLERAVTGGDDYEILCTVASGGEAAFAAAARAAGVPVARIGEVTRGTAPPLFRDGQGNEVSFARASYAHF